MPAFRRLTGFLLFLLFLILPLHAQKLSTSDELLDAGRAALQQKQYAESIRLLEDGHRRFPADQRLALELGRAYLFDHQDARAIQLFRKILSQDPSHRGAKLELARALGYQRDFTASDKLYREILSADPDDEPAATGLVRNLLHEKRYAEARAVLDPALARHPNSTRLQEYKQRLDQKEAGGKKGPRRKKTSEKIPVIARRQGRVQGSGAYFSNSAGSRSWRFTQQFGYEVVHNLEARFLAEERSLWNTAGPKANVHWLSGELRWRLSPVLLFSGSGGTVRFADSTSNSIYRGDLEFHPAKRLWLAGGFSRRPISPTFLSTQFDVLAEGWHGSMDWNPGPLRSRTTFTREHYSDGNIGKRFDTELVDWIGVSQFSVGLGGRARYMAFTQNPLHGYFSPSTYGNFEGVAGIKFKLGKAFRAEYTAGMGGETIAAGPLRSAWELALRNRAQFGSLELGLDYFHFHLAQNTGAFNSQATRFSLAYTF